MKIKGNFVCQDKLSYVSVTVRPPSKTKLLYFTYNKSRNNKHLFIFLFILSLIISFLITYLNIGRQLKNHRLIPNAYQRAEENDSLFNILNKYKNVIDKMR